MKSVILAGGYAKRLWPITSNMPKPLLQVAGRPVIEYILEKLETISEIDTIYISTNKKFENHFNKWLLTYKSRKLIKLIVEDHDCEEEKLGVIGSLKYLIAQENVHDDLLVIAGDNFFDFRIEDFLEYYKKKEASIIALYDVGEIQEPGNGNGYSYGIGVLNDGKRIIEFKEKPKVPLSPYISTCVYVLRSKDLFLISDYLGQGNNPDAPGYFLEWLHTRNDVYGFVFGTSWFDVGTLDSLNNLYRKVRSMNENLLRKMLEEEVYDLRWSSCLKGHEKGVEQYKPKLGISPVERSEFEQFVEETFPVGFQNDIKLVQSIGQALINLYHNPYKKQAVVVGKDIRPGTDFIVRSFMNTLLRNENLTVYYVEESTTAFVAFCANQLAKTNDLAFSVQLSASHTEWFKIGVEPQYGSLSQNIPGSPFNAEDLDMVRQETVKIEDIAIKDVSKGKFVNIAEEMFSKYNDFVERLFRTITNNEQTKTDLLLLADTGNNISKKFVTEIFDRLKINYKLVNEEYKYISDRENDPNHANTTKLMKDRSNLFKDGFIGTAYDTDVDRSPFFDEKGEIIPGDWIAAIIIKHLISSCHGFVFGFETNNHFGIPIIGVTGKIVVATADAGLFLEEIRGASIVRVSIGKPFVYSKISAIAGRDVECIPHTDGPLISAIVYFVMSKICKGRSIRDSILSEVGEINTFKILRRDINFEHNLADKSVSRAWAKRFVLRTLLSELERKGLKTTRYDQNTGIAEEDGIRVFLRCSGHNNFLLRVSLESKKQTDLNERMIEISDIIKKSAESL